MPAVWPVGIFFFSVPLDGTVLFFSVPMFAGDPDGLAGQKGGPVDCPTKEVASPGHCKSEVSWG